MSDTGFDVPLGQAGGQLLEGPRPLGERCLVTGGTGFIGSNLVHALTDRGDTVRVFDDLSTGRLMNLGDLLGDVEVVEGDLRDDDAVAAALRGTGAAFHLGAIPSVARSVADPRTTHDVNLTGTINVLLAARDAGCERVVFASSSAVYGEQATFPLHEGLVCRPISPYGVSKLAGERYMLAFRASYGLATVALRFFNVFGPRQNPAAEYAAVVPRFIERSLAGEQVTIYGDGEQARDFVFVDDVVRACLLAAEAPQEAWGGAFNIASGGRRSVNELAAAIADVVGPGLPEPTYADPRPGDVRESHADVMEADRALGYVPLVELEQGLRRTVAWIAEERDLGLL
jgi:nucleoside-diphosphate-sugar epimerase